MYLHGAVYPPRTFHIYFKLLLLFKEKSIDCQMKNECWAAMAKTLFREDFDKNSSINFLKNENGKIVLSTYEASI